MNNEPLDLNWQNAAELTPPPFRLAPAPISDGIERPAWCPCGIHRATPQFRQYRHEQAKTICRRCPVAFQCGLSVDWQWDEGIRAGHLLPEKKNAVRPPSERVA